MIFNNINNYYYINIIIINKRNINLKRTSITSSINTSTSIIRSIILKLNISVWVWPLWVRNAFG